MVCLHQVFCFFLMLCSGLADIIFREEPVDSPVVLGHPFSFHCLVEDNENRGQIVIQWRHNNAPVQVNSDSRLNQFPNGTLFFTSTETEDEGSYSCLASVIVTNVGIVDQRASIAATLSFAFINGVFYSPSNQTVTDQQATYTYFQCISGDSLPLATITWEKDGQLLEGANTVSTLFGAIDSKKMSGSLQLDNVRMRHAGRYRCITTNPLLPGQPQYSTYAWLSVIPHPGRPYINQAPTSQIVPLGNPSAFVCEILGDPSPDISWLKDGEDMASSDDGRIMVHSNGTLSFSSVEEADEGTYACNGTSTLGTVVSEGATLLTAYIDWNFLQEPDDLTVIEEDVATLFCHPPNSKPTAEVTWYKDNILLTPRAGVAILDVGDLYISAVMLADEGEYFCVATNEYVPRSLTSRSARLEVRVGATITDPPAKTDVTLGDDLSLTCAATGDPDPTLRWLKDTIEITVGGRVTIGNSGGLLHIIGMTSLDRGTYTCVAGNDYGTDQESVYVNVLVPPRLVIAPLHLSTGIGTSILMPCKVIAEPPPIITWFKDGTELTSGPFDGHYQKTNDGLFIRNVVLSDNGTYLCYAENKVGTLEVNGSVTVETVPYFTQVPQNQTISEGGVVFFQCRAGGVPLPVISWTLEGGPLPTGVSLSDDHRVLTISEASRELDGLYTCKGENTQGVITVDAYLHVKTAPVIDPFLNLTAKSGEMFSVFCNVLYGFSDLSFLWLKGGNILTANRQVSFPQPSQLQIELQGNVDQGWYTCVATNFMGSDRESFYLSVIDIPAVPVILDVIALSEFSILVTWMAKGEPEDTESFEIQYKPSSESWKVAESSHPSTLEIESLTIEGLKENREYHIRVISRSSVGSSQPSTTYVAYTPSVSGPSVPRSLLVTFFNATNVQLEWEIPEERSGPITVYYIEYVNDQENVSSTIEVPGEDRYTIVHTISNLRPNSLYTFQLCAATSYEGELLLGNCTHSIHQSTLTAAPDGAPTDVHLVALSSTSISVSWSPVPEFNQNGEILGYNIIYRILGVADHPVIMPVNASGSSLVITELEPWTRYAVHVEAYNADGHSPPSSDDVIQTKVTAPSGGPRITTNQTLNETTIYLSWMVLEENIRHGPIDGYIVTWNEVGSGNMTTANVSSTSFTITGLTVSTMFEVVVSAYNQDASGEMLVGPKSVPETIATADGVPGRISKLRFGETGSSFVFLKWSPPSLPNGDILRYKLQYTAITETQKDLQNRTRRETNNNATYGVVYTKETEYNLTGLAAGTNFTLVIMAETAAGLGNAMTFIFTTDETELMKTLSAGKGDVTPKPGAVGNDLRLFGLPLNSFIIFTSSVGLAFLFFLFAIFFITAWCSRASGKKQVKNRLVPLLRNDQFVQIANHHGEDGIDNYSSTESSPPSSTVAAPVSSHQVLDEQNLIENRPRASSSPASAQLAIKVNHNHFGEVAHYGTNPRQETSRSARSLDASPDQLDNLYQKVNRTSRGPSRFQKDSLAAIAALLDQEESDNEARPPDSPPSVVIADQRTVL